MFHGSIRVLLDKEPGGGVIRSHLYTFIMDYLSGKPFSESCFLHGSNNTLARWVGWVTGQSGSKQIWVETGHLLVWSNVIWSG